MKVKDAKNKVCPYLKSKCITDECMMWKTTVNGKKEIAREIEPYDMTPMDLRFWRDGMIKDGYVEEEDKNGFRSVYVKYKESFEGYCRLTKTKDKK